MSILLKQLVTWPIVTRVLHRMALNIFVHPVLSLEDNFAYILADKQQGVCALVDPVEPEKALSALSTIVPPLELKCVLTTHHHWDHAGGNKKLREMRPQLPIYGGDSRIDGLSEMVKDNDVFKLGSFEIRCISTPCHTSGHICYLVTSGPESVVFTGDTLFIAGCGRFFEGNGQQMYTALVEKLGSLKKDTKVYCGHEYTVANLRYARHVEPDNANITKKLEWANEVCSSGRFTVPSTIEEEFLTNPFMRVNQEAVQRHAGCKDSISTMAKLREEKNNFR